MFSYSLHHAKGLFSICALTLECNFSIFQDLFQLSIPFHLLLGKAGDVLPSLVDKHQITAVVCDFSPLRVPKGWYQEVGEKMEKKGIPLIQVWLSYM